MPGGRLVLVSSRFGPDRILAALDGWENVEVERHDGMRLVTAGRPCRLPTGGD